MEESTVTIADRFQGPPESGNGGYSCGMLGRFFEGPAVVTLRKPPPLNKPLSYERDGAVLKLMDGADLIAEAQPAELDISPPRSMRLQEAREAANEYVGFKQHLFPHCFVCGPDRKEHDGLRIFAGPAGDVVAAPWYPDESLADDNGNVSPEFVWAALDCPGFFAAFNGRELEPALLGRMTAKPIDKVRAGEAHVVIGWPIASEGRKHTVGTAIFKPNGALAAVGKGLWITVGSSA